MRRLGKFGLAPLALFAFAGSPCFADIVGTTGMLTVVSAPPSVVVGADQSDTTAIVFFERSTTVPSGGLAVDVISPGTYAGGGPAPAPGTIPAGTSVTSYLIHSDPGNPPINYIGSVTFSTRVLGIEILSDSLSATDGGYGHVGTTYSDASARGMEAADSITLSANRQTVSIDFNTHDRIDEVRIFTATVPEPGTMALAAVGAAAFAAARLRRRGPRA